MLANEDPLDPPAIEDSKCQIASNLADNFIPTKLILLMNIPSAIIHSQHDTVNLVDSSEVLIPGPKCFTSRPLFESFYRQHSCIFFGLVFASFKPLATI
jgi:hypothetical protein